MKRIAAVISLIIALILLGNAGNDFLEREREAPARINAELHAIGDSG